MKTLSALLILSLSTWAFAQSYSGGLNPPSVGQTNKTAPISATLGGYVDSSGKLQPFTGTPGGGGISVSVGSVDAVQSGAWDIRNITGTVTLPTNAATEPTLAAIGVTLTSSAMKTQIASAAGITASVHSVASQVTSADNGLVTNATLHGLSTAGGGTYVDAKVNPSGALSVDATQSGTWNIGSITNPVSITGSVTATASSVNASNISRVSNSGSSQTLAASNASRKGLYIYNDSTTNCYYKFGTSASTTSFSVKLFATDTFTMDPPIYNGAVTFVCDSATGSSEATEL